MLKNHIIPNKVHTLTFSNVYLNSLNMMDRSIRSFIRRWLRLASDTSLGVFYAPSSVGGIAITRLLAIPVLRLKICHLFEGMMTLLIKLFLIALF